MTTLTLITPTCSCCETPQVLVPRDDLPGDLAVCQGTGQLYRPEGQGYVPTPMPALPTPLETPQSVQVDLNRYGYA